MGWRSFIEGVEFEPNLQNGEHGTQEEAGERAFAKEKGTDKGMTIELTMCSGVGANNQNLRRSGGGGVRQETETKL